MEHTPVGMMGGPPIQEALDTGQGFGPSEETA